MIRAATADDAAFLVRMLAEAADWRVGASTRSVDEVLGDAHLARYVAGWPRPSDVGVIAEDADGEPVGAAWCRHLGAAEPGYGFVSPDVPELSIGVVPARVAAASDAR